MSFVVVMLTHHRRLEGKPPYSGSFYRQAARSGCSGLLADCQKSLAEFAAEAANKIKILFGRGVYVDENTSQAASVEFVRQRRTNYARSRLQNTGGKAQRAFSTRAQKGLQQQTLL